MKPRFANVFADPDDEDEDQVPIERRRLQPATTVEKPSEEDDLDALMARVHAQAQADVSAANLHIAKVKEQNDKFQGKEQEEEEMYTAPDLVEDFVKARAAVEEEEKKRRAFENPNYKYDEDGQIIMDATTHKVVPLKEKDHTGMEYEPFEKVFYKEAKEVSSMDHFAVLRWRSQEGIHIGGQSVSVNPCLDLQHFPFHFKTMHIIRNVMKYTTPTPIQAQGVPIIMSGYDVIGQAKTGSGKTAAFLWPMFPHVMAQRSLNPKEGPIALILAPTRELVSQIYKECKRYAKAYQLRVVHMYGGGNKMEQYRTMRQGAEIVVSTPVRFSILIKELREQGRCIDMYKMRGLNFKRVTYFVIDEADRLFDLGFEKQVNSICKNVRPDRHTCLFSATMNRKVEELIDQVTVSPVHITIGRRGAANEDVRQVAVVVPNEQEKLAWVVQNLDELIRQGGVLLFGGSRDICDYLVHRLRTQFETRANALHGQMSSAERSKAMKAFRTGTDPVLVATDVAARGLDIPNVKTVICYANARKMDAHVHRIGRTGRAGTQGVAYSIILEKDVQYAGQLVRHFERSHQPVSEVLLRIAKKSAEFRSSHREKYHTVPVAANAMPVVSTSVVTSTKYVQPPPPPPAVPPSKMVFASTPSTHIPQRVPKKRMLGDGRGGVGADRGMKGYAAGNYTVPTSQGPVSDRKRQMLQQFQGSFARARHNEMKESFIQAPSPPAVKAPDFAAQMADAIAEARARAERGGK